ncbi:MAG: hypothetical protein ACSW73_00250 [Spirochaetales bacterium]
MTQTTIYIGLNDAVTKTQIFETEKYIKILKDVCCAYHTSFSFDVIEGGYIHDSGEYTKENTLQLTLIDVEKKRVEEIAKDLCAFFHQESVLITESSIRSYYVRESIN